MNTGDTIEHHFYVRIETEIIADVKKLKDDLYFILPVEATVTLRSLPEKKVIVLVSKEYHCLADILIRNQFKTLGASVQCVIGNHAGLQIYVTDLRYHFTWFHMKIRIKHLLQPYLPKHCRWCLMTGYLFIKTKLLCWSEPGLF